MTLIVGYGKIVIVEKQNNQTAAAKHCPTKIGGLKVDIKKIGKQPKDIVIVYVEAILMPNGEVIHAGKTLGFYKNLKNYLHIDSE